MPNQYRKIRAAKVLNCSPWELDNVDSTWIDWALISERADNLVQKALYSKNSEID
jgi:hypothetical protein